MLSEGDLAPDFTCLAHTGETVKLSDLRGKRVLLWFYPMADTPGCTAEGCSFRDLKPTYAGKNVEILGVSFDGVEANRSSRRSLVSISSCSCDTDKKIGLAYGAAGDASAGDRDAYRYLIGADGRVERAYGKVSANEHPAAALAEL